MSARPLLAAAAAVLIVGVALGASRAQQRAPTRLDEGSFRADIPGTWRALPTLAASASRAALEAADSDRLRIDARAWGDPSEGVFALVQDARMTSGGSARELHEALQAQLGGVTTLGDWQFEERDGRARSSASVRTERFRGHIQTVSTRDGNGLVHAIAVVCFYNDREPQRSARRCEQFLRTFEALP